MRYSFVLPVFNEVESLQELHRRLSDVIADLEGTAEMIFVDDGSTDGSFEQLEALAEKDKRVRIVQFSRNFGHQPAISAGLDLAKGDAVVVMDSDLQHPPELVVEMAAKWLEGYDVVYAIRGDRSGEGVFKRVASRGFYKLLSRMTDTEIPQNAGDFRLVDRTVLHAFRNLRETNLYLRGMFSWLGFRQIGVPYGYYERYGGVPKYTTRRMMRFGVDGMTSFSNAPLHMALHLGFYVSALSLLNGLIAVITKLAGADVVPGWATIVLTISFFGGVQLLVLGVIGLYIGRMFDELKGRPAYVVRQVRGFDRAPTVRDEPIVLPSRR